MVSSTVNDLIHLFEPKVEPLQEISLSVRDDLWVEKMKEYSTFPKISPSDFFNVIYQDTRLVRSGEMQSTHSTAPVNWDDVIRSRNINVLSANVFIQPQRHGQDMTQGKFFSEVQLVWIQVFVFLR